MYGDYAACGIIGNMPGSGLCRVIVLLEKDPGGSREDDRREPGIIKDSPGSVVGGRWGGSEMV
jgi:hypothetical protein